jgi:hypothetical protein
VPVPHISENFGDLLDLRFHRIFDEELSQLPDMIPNMFNMEPQNGQDQMRFSDVGTLADFTPFDGTVAYQDQVQGYDSAAIYVEFTNGIQVRRKLFDDDQFNVMDQRPRGLAASANRTRQKHGARIFNNAFSVDTFFYTNSEGVPLCSNSHTTNTSASTANGFDNLVTDGLTAVAVNTAWVQMMDFRDDQAGRFEMNPDQLLVPTDLWEAAEEIRLSSGQLDTAQNNANVWQGKFETMRWQYLNDANNWFLMDSAKRALFLMWIDRIALEFGMIEDFDTFIAKWRAYMRYANIWTNWRWLIGAQVA